MHLYVRVQFASNVIAKAFSEIGDSFDYPKSLIVSFFIDVLYFCHRIDTDWKENTILRIEKGERHEKNVTNAQDMHTTSLL